MPFVVADALGQVTTLQYEDGDPLKVTTSVTDPFGRVARFTYDGEGHLTSVTDVIDFTSTFQHSQYGFINTPQTPYGLTAFRQPSGARRTCA